MNIQIILIIYGAWLLTIILHEIGHLPLSFKINLGLINVPHKNGICIRIFPPEGASMVSRSQFGGLLINFLIVYLGFILQPRNLFLQIFILINWIYLMWYLIWGSFNYEPKIPDWMKQYFIMDDIPNELWWVAVPLGIWIFYYFRVYYLTVLMQIIGGLL